MIQSAIRQECNTERIPTGMGGNDGKAEILRCENKPPSQTANLIIRNGVSAS